MVRRLLFFALVFALPLSSAQGGTNVATRVGAFVSQSPPGILRLPPEATTTVSVTFNNVGSVSWSNDPASSNYVELRSVNSTGTVTQASPLAWNWLSGSTVSIAALAGTVFCPSGESNPANSVTLLWTAPGDDANVGTASRYDLRYATAAITASNFGSANAFGAPPTPQPAGSTDSCTVVGLVPATTYYFALKAADEVPNWSGLSNVVSKATAPTTVTFSFGIKAPTSTGRYTLYLGLYHPASARVIATSIPSVVLDVVSLAGGSYQAFSGRLNGDALADVGLYEPTSGAWYVMLRDAASNQFVPQPDAWLAGWGAGAPYRFVKDFSGDGYADIGVFYPTLGRWFVAYNWGSEFRGASGPAANGSWLDGFGVGSPGEVVPFAADFNHDGLTDVGYYRPTLGRWFIALNRGGRFEAANGPGPEGSWLDGYGAAPYPTYQPYAADLSGDGFADVGLYHNSTGRWFVAYNWGSEFRGASGPAANGSWLDGWAVENGALRWQYFTGKSSADAADDILVYTPQFGRWFVAINQVGSFKPQAGPDPGSSWLDSWAVEDGSFRWQILMDDFSGDGFVEPVAYTPRTGTWFVAYNWGDRFRNANGTTGNGAWLSGWGMDGPAGANIAARVVPNSAETPQAFAVHRAQPNPFHDQTTIRFTLPGPSWVRLMVFDVHGRRVANLWDAEQTAGDHALAWNANGKLAAGIYFARLETSFGTATRRLTLLR